MSELSPDRLAELIRSIEADIGAMTYSIKQTELQLAEDKRRFAALVAKRNELKGAEQP